MGEDQTLIAWAGKQIAWVGDALRRHAQSPLHELGAQDKSDIVTRVRHAAGFVSDSDLDHSPLEAGHLSVGSSPEPQTLLCSLGPVEHIGRLAPQQQLRFALDGITLIYGDNGSGKTGYARIAKKVCRSITKDDLLGDIFTDGAKPPASALIRFRINGSSDITEETWIDGSTPPDAIKNISVFDSKNARFYVDNQNKIGFLPAEISLLERHATHRREMDEQFEKDKSALEAKCKVALPAGFTPGGQIAQALAKMMLKAKDLPTQTELEDLAKWSSEDETELAALTKSLAQDPGDLAARSERASAAISGFLKTIELIEEELNPERPNSAKTKYSTAIETAKAAALVAENVFSNEPLAGVGGEPWRLMFEHARSYVASLPGGSDLATGPDDLCALCQTPLGDEGSERIKRFSEFLSGETAKAADAAAIAVTGELTALNALLIPTSASVDQALSEYRSISEERSKLGLEISTYFSVADARRNAIVKALVDGGSDDIPALSASPSAALKKDSETLIEHAQTLKDEAKANTKQAENVARKNELKDRELLKNSLPTVLSRLADLNEHSKTVECIRLVNTQQVSTQITAIRRSLVTAGLDARIKAEIEGMKLGHIPFEVSDQSQNGNSLFGVRLKAPIAAANDKILSEGEQRALALACFLAEVGADTQNHGLIIDDPVSSLDHLRIRKVAERLVTEAAKGKQIIIFTHNLVFYNEVLNAATSASPSIPVARRTISKTHADGFGLISETEEPWVTRKVTDRIATLRSTAKSLEDVTDTNTEGYRSVAKDFFTDLRETWERLVEEILLGKVVERYSSDVRTQSLKAVVVEDSDYKEIFWAMKKASEFSGHDQPAGKQISIPTVADMKAALDVIENYRLAIKKRADTTSAERAKLEKPKPALVA